VLAFFLEQRRAGHRCVFASITDAPELRTLAERARDASNAAQTREDGFAEFTVKFLVKKKWRELFEELRRQWDNADEAETFSLLCGIEVRSSDDYTLSQDLSYTLRVMFDAPGMTTLDSLRTFYQDSVHQVLTDDSQASRRARHSSAGVCAGRERANRPESHHRNLHLWSARQADSWTDDRAHRVRQHYRQDCGGTFWTRHPHCRRGW
jgi:hypothetical protein